ncbi:hypothetical protein EGT07_11110 [Herbaspirillum sp. HC18]|nr:hypothetical protein EGT07_11110 [Herbaspirillum sp. HC18]
MKLSRAAIQILAAVAVSALAPHAGAEEHRHRPAQEGRAVSPESPAKKWKTDDVVRSGMDTIRKAVLKNEAAMQKDRPDADEYKKLAQLIDSNIADIVKNCKLAKDADAAFHTVVLVDLTHGSELMRVSTKPAVQRAGELAVMQTLRTYGKYFEHPGWTMNPASSQ